MRLAGATYADIAAELGYRDRAGAHKAVTRWLEREPRAAAAELRDAELARLDRLLTSAMPAALEGDWAAARVVLRTIELRSRLLGLLEAPAPAYDHAIGDVFAAMLVSAQSFADQYGSAGPPSVVLPLERGE
ncbi:hypothetical protein [Agromyces binzhouensis]|uniref:hypothetical protein n=1 Tax=Agromyces binzhouensis TaxID=1817495 RepID=UPI003640CD0B